MGCQFVFAAEGEEWKGFSVHICRTGHKSLTYTPTHMSEKRTMRLLMACAIGTLAGMVLTVSTTSWLCMVLRVSGGGAFNVSTQRKSIPFIV
jgi:hypothetical protein